jgi:hypothetical protein
VLPNKLLNLLSVCVWICSAAKPDAAAGISLGLGSLWNVATAVTSAVKQSADEVVKSVQHTDWKSELTAFTQEVEAEAHKAVEVVQHLPQHIQLPHEQQQQQGTRLSRISEVRRVSSSNNSLLLAAANSLAGSQQLRWQCFESPECVVPSHPASLLCAPVIHARRSITAVVTGGT